MKLIPLRDGQNFKSKAILTQVASLSPGKAINLDDMRKRVRILDALEKADASLVLEDADHAVLKAAIIEFPFNVAHPEILRIIEDVIEAKEPTAPFEKAA